MGGGGVCARVRERMRERENNLTAALTTLLTMVCYGCGFVYDFTTAWPLFDHRFDNCE